MGPSWRASLRLYAAVALGGALGAMLRWLVGIAFLHLAGFPWATLFANVTGSGAIGFYARLTGPDGRLFAGPRMRQLVMSGACGGYTTFSLFGVEALQLIERGAGLAAVGYIGVSVVAWLAAAWLGDALAARLNRLKGAKS